MAENVTILQPAPVRKTVVTVGQGPAGTAGVGGGAYQHSQPVAASPWIVNHNLGFRPNVSVLSVGGVEMWAEVIHISVNQVQVLFDDPRAGLALCS